MGYKKPRVHFEPESYQYKAAIISFLVSIVLLILKFWAFNLTGSQAIFSDALESIVNVVASLLVIIVVHYSNQPADVDHPYGHGKVEYFSAAFEGGLISFAALFILIDGTKALIMGHHLHELNTGLVIVGGAGIVNLILGLFLKKYGKEHNSDALLASGHHIISDFWTSFGVVVGLILVKLTGLIWLDSVMAIGVSFLLMKTGYKIISKSISGLLDAESIEDLKLVVDTFSKFTGKCVIQVHHVKMIRSGHFHHIDAHLVVPQFWNVLDVHENIDQFESDITKDYPYYVELHFHLDPCRQAYCKVCDIEDCPIRKEPFEERIPVGLEQFRNPNEPEEFREG